MSVDPFAGPAGRVPRFVWALLSVIVLVFGFAVGGSLRTALAAGHNPAAATRVRGVADIAVGGLIAPAGAPTVDRRAGPTSVRVSPGAPPSRSAVRRGVPLPAGSGAGRRIVYQESTMHLWVVEADGTVTRDYPVTGRPDWPMAGTYHVFSRSVASASPAYHVTFDWMVRFAHGHHLPIGFHSIPRWIGSGLPIQSESSLGAPIGHGGCVRQTYTEAKWLYAWASVGTTVVVLR